MSQADVEVLREVVDAANRRDPDAFIACLHPEVVWDDSEGFARLRGVYRGQAEARAWFEAAVVDPWESLRVGIDEIIEAGDGRVVVGGPVSGRGRTSGAEAEIHVWAIFALADGKVVSRAPF